MIPIREHSKLMASKVVNKFNEDIPVRAGLDGLFPRETTPTLYVDVEVSRDNDLIAVDVQRFTEGNKNKLTVSTESKYLPPYFKEEYDFARDEIYMNTVGLGVTNNGNVNAAIAQNALKVMRNNRKKIERAIRKQQAQVLQTGIVTLKNGDSIDYRRKAASIVDLGAGNYWDQAGIDPRASLKVGMDFLRHEGNSSASTINVVMRSASMDTFLANPAITKTADFRRIDRINITMPAFSETSGLAFHGQVAAGDFVYNLWSYNEKYTNANGQTEYYLNSENILLLPGDFMGKTVFGGLPYMRSATVAGQSTMVPAVKSAQYAMRAYSDEKTISSTLELSSAPLVIPFTIDKMYTIKAFGS